MSSEPPSDAVSRATQRLPKRNERRAGKTIGSAVGLVVLLAITGTALLSVRPLDPQSGSSRPPEATVPAIDGEETHPVVPTESVPTQAVSAVPPTAAIGFRVEATVTDQCGSEGGCAYYADLGGPAGPWRAKFAWNQSGVPLVIDGGLPSALIPGDYILTLSSFLVSDVTVNNEPPQESLDATCSAEFSVMPRQDAILFRGTFDADECSVAPRAVHQSASPTPGWQLTVTSPSFPMTTIECRGSPPISESECVAWAERILNGPPNLAQTTGRLVLTNRAGGSRCAADFYDSSGRVDWTAAVACPSSPAGDEIALWSARVPTMVDGHEVCRLALGGGELARHPESGLGVKNRLGDIQPIVWPFGYTARQDRDSAVLVDRVGAIVAREGDLVQFGGGLNLDGVFAACGGVEVVQASS